MKKIRLSALLLSVALLLCVPVQAAKNSTSNFVRSKSYAGEFSDLAPESTFYPNVTALYEYGLSVGKPDGTYGLQEPLTVGQVVIFAGRIRSLYETGTPEPTLSAPLSSAASPSQTYLLYLKERGILGSELDRRLHANATRAEVAHVLADLLPPEALPPVHANLINAGYAARRIIPDVTESTPYSADILQLYRTGISRGCDNQGSYCPDEPISRGAVAAMLTRMVDPSLRVVLSWSSAANQTLSSLVTDAVPVKAPTTAQEIDACVRHMLFTDTNTIALKYPALTQAESSKIMSAVMSCVKSYCEQGYNSVSCIYTPQGSMNLTFSAANLSPSKLRIYRQETMATAIAVHDQLWAEGSVTSDMSDTQKALVYYTWIAEHCTYDNSAGTESLSHLPYGLFRNGLAVCDGYTGAYNLFLKLEGIPCTALANEDHIWTVAELDGKEVHIDVTWGDQGSYTDYTYFAMTPQQSRKVHPW